MTRYSEPNIDIDVNDGWKSFYLGHDADDDTHYSVTVNWSIPYRWQGNTISLRFYVKWKDEHSGTLSGNFDSYDSPQPPESKVSLMDPMLAYDKAHIGQILIPFYIQASQCTKLTLKYTDSITGENSINQNPALSGNVYVPMDRTLTDVMLIAAIVDANGNQLSDVSSIPIVVNPLHIPDSFNVEIQEDGNVKISWEVKDSLSGDIMEDDFWEIQRNMTGETDSHDPH